MEKWRGGMRAEQGIRRGKIEDSEWVVAKFPRQKPKYHYINDFIFIRFINETILALCIDLLDNYKKNTIILNFES